MGKLVVNNSLINESNAPDIVKLCPFGALSYKDGRLDISDLVKEVDEKLKIKDSEE